MRTYGSRIVCDQACENQHAYLYKITHVYIGKKNYTLSVMIKKIIYILPTYLICKYRIQISSRWLEYIFEDIATMH